jgi:methionine aminotransferase
MISKLPNVTTSIFAVMSKMAIDNNALNLSQGYPDFESDPLLIDLVSQAMKEGFNQYAPMAGEPSLREEISKKSHKLYNISYDPDSDITVTAGATQAIFTAIAATVDKGDEVIIFTPAYDCYQPTVELFGGKTIPIQLKAPDYQVDWDEVSDSITNKTKLVIINTPHNPSGTILSRTDMETLQSLVVKHGLYMISDEVYEHIIFDGHTHYSAALFPDLAQRTFITASFGKTFHNTGWKMGYCLAPKTLMREFQKVHQFNVFSVNHPIQKALAIYLRTPKHYFGLSELYQKKRDLFLDLMKDSRFKFIPSKGTYFQMLDYSEITDKGDRSFAEKLTKEYKVATIPTSVFNANERDFKQLRVCFAKRDDTLKNAAKILNSI